MFFCGAHVSLKPDRTTTTPDFRLGARFPARRVVVNLRGQKGGGGVRGASRGGKMRGTMRAINARHWVSPGSVLRFAVVDKTHRFRKT